MAVRSGGLDGVRVADVLHLEGDAGTEDVVDGSIGAEVVNEFAERSEPATEGRGGVEVLVRVGGGTETGEGASAVCVSCYDDWGREG